MDVIKFALDHVLVLLFEGSFFVAADGVFDLLEHAAFRACALFEDLGVEAVFCKDGVELGLQLEIFLGVADSGFLVWGAGGGKERRFFLMDLPESPDVFVAG